MKNSLKIVVVLLSIFIFNITIVSASTNTNERTENNYLVEDWVKITDANKDNILNTPAVNATEKIYDFADLYSDSEEIKLYDEISKYIDSYNMDLAIVTINQNNKLSPQEYADDFYDYNNFGISSNRDGVLFLIDMQNRELYMSTTGISIEMYNDYRIDKALDSVYQYMSDKFYYDGTYNFIKIIGDFAKEGLPKNNSIDGKESNLSVLIKAMVIGLIVTVIVMAILISKNKLVRKATTAEEYLNKDSVNIKKISDVLISSNITKHRIDHSSSSGGSSTHSGSSGSSHGGGGHGF